MEQILFTLAEVSVSAGIIITAICLLRLFCRQIPRRFFVMLWVVVAVRLLCPFSVSTRYALIPSMDGKLDTLFTSEPAAAIPNTPDLPVSVPDNPPAQQPLSPALPADAAEDTAPFINTPDVSFVTPAADNSSPSLVSILAFMWLGGAALLAAYLNWQYLLLKKRLSTAVMTDTRRIKETDRITSPFVLGVFRPVIYLPVNLSPQERQFVLAHEQSHIRHADHIIKFLFLAALLVHWFNPLVWLAFTLWNRDMEMTCDERVLGSFEDDVRSRYSKTLLALSVRQSGLRISLAFGESSVKSRITHILNFKKPAVWVTLAGMILLVLIIPQCFATRALKADNLEEDTEYLRLLAQNRHEEISDTEGNNLIIEQLPLQEGLSVTNISTYDNSELIYVTLQLNPQILPDLSALDKLKEHQNALLVFSCIRSLKTLTFLYQTTDSDSGLTTHSFSREANVSAFGNLYNYSASAEELQTLMDACANAHASSVQNQSPSGRNLTMEDLIEAFENNSVDKIDFSSYRNRRFDEDPGYEYDSFFNYTIRYLLTYNGKDYQVDAHYSRYRDGLTHVYITKLHNWEFFRLYDSTYYTDPVYFHLGAADNDFTAYLNYDPEVTDWLQISLPPGYSVESFSYANTGAGEGASLIGPEFYEDYEEYGISTVPDWISAGSVGPISQADIIIEDGVIVQKPILWNHSGETAIGMLEGFDDVLVLLEYVEHDILTLNDWQRLEEAGVDPDSIQGYSSYWYFFFIKEGTPRGYYLALSSDIFSQEEAIAIARTIRFTENAFAQ